MKPFSWIGVMVVLAAAMTACSVDQTGGAAQTTAPAGSGDVTAAATPGGGQARGGAQMQTFNQVSTEIWYLADSPTNPITKDQAARLLVIYQQFQAGMALPAPTPGPGTTTPAAGGGSRGFGGMDPATIQNNLTAIQAILTPDQLAEVNKLTQDQITATMQKHGLNFGGGRPTGTPGSTPTPNPQATPRPPGNPFLNETLKVLQAIINS